MTRLDNSGILSRSERKDVENPDHEHWADFEGNVMIDGKRYWISAWIKEQKKEPYRKFFALSFRPVKPRDNATTS